MKAVTLRLISLGALFAPVLAAQSQMPAATAPSPIHASKIILTGDSTVAVQGGWGSSFCSEHVTSFVACVNLGRGGRSSGSYIAEGSWDLAMNEARTPGFVATYVLIQFGHNDQPGKPGRSTDLATEFPANLRRYVDDARSVGAQPVLITSLTRRQFKNGVLQSDLAPWAEATRRIAVEMKVPLVDLNALSSKAIQAMGSTQANTMAQRPPSAQVAAAAKTGTTIEAATGTTEVVTPPPAAAVAGMAQPRLAFDYTHLGRHGSDYFATMVATELAIQVPALRPLLIP